MGDDRQKPSKSSTDSMLDTVPLLLRHQSGDVDARSQLRPVVYEQLRAVAQRCFGGQPSDHTLQPTALVNEAYVKLAGSDENPKNRAHFLSLAAVAMRQILIDHARRKRALKRNRRVRRCRRLRRKTSSTS